MGFWDVANLCMMHFDNDKSSGGKSAVAKSMLSTSTGVKEVVPPAEPKPVVICGDALEMLAFKKKTKPKGK